MADTPSQLARVISDDDLQYVINALTHASLALALVEGETAFAAGEEGSGHVIDNSRTLALIDCALCRLGVDTSADLPVREISSCTDRGCAPRNTDPSTVRP